MITLTGCLALALTLTAQSAELEADTPDAWEPTAVTLARESRDSTAEHAALLGTAPAATLRAAREDAMDGGDDGGLRGAWTLAGSHAGAARDEAARSFTLLPELATLIAADRAETGTRVASEFPHAWQLASARWQEALALDLGDFSDLRDDLDDADARAEDRALDAATWAMGLTDELAVSAGETESSLHAWTVAGARDAWRGVAVRAPGRFMFGARQSAVLLASTPGAARDAVVDGNSDAAAAWLLARTSTSGAASAVMPETWRAWGNASRRSRALASWLLQHPLDPAARLPVMVGGIHRWSVDGGWNRGVVAGFRAAGEAREAGDHGMALAWTAGALGRGAGHAALEAGLVPPLVLGTLASTALLAAGGWSGVVLAGAGGVALGAATAGAGVLSTAALATTGTALTGLAAGSGVARAGLVLVGGTLAAGSTLAAASAVAAGTGAFHAARLVLVPASGFTAAAAVRGAQVTATTLAWGGAALAAAGARGWQALYSGLRPLPTLAAVTARSGVALAAGGADLGLGAPAGILVDAGGHVARTTGWLAEHPALATAEALQSTAVAARGALRAGGIMTRGLTVAGIQVIGESLATTTYAVVTAVAGVGVAGTWMVRALDIPLHRAWAAARQDETEEVLRTLQAQGVAPGGHVAVMRVHWWGPESGRVRFFVVRDRVSAQRWYFQRSVDADSCEVTYRGTQRDPARRLLGGDAGWTAPLHSGLYERGCMEQRSDAGQEVASAR